MAVELGFFKTACVAEAFEYASSQAKIRESSEEILIDINALNVPDEIVPLVENVNTFIALKDFERASAAADKIIDEYPNSCAGWYAKAVAVTNNFAPNRTFFMDAECKFMQYKLNAVKVADEKSKEFLAKKSEEYEKEVIFYTELYYMNMIVNFVKACLDNDSCFDDDMLEVTVLTMRKAFAEINEKDNLKILLERYPNNIVFALCYYFFAINAENYKSQLNYYGVTASHNPMDYYNKRPIKYLQRSEEIPEEFFERNNLNPEHSTQSYTDGFISYMTTACRLLQLCPGKMKQYYSDEARAEIAKLEEEDEARRREEARREREERERKEEEERRLLQKEKNIKIIKYSAIGLLILFVIKLILRNF